MTQIRKVEFPSKDALMHFLAENELCQFAVLKYGDNYELAYVEEMEDQPSMA